MKGALMNFQALSAWVRARIGSGDRGAAVVEYGMLLVLLVVIGLVGVRAFGGGVSTQYSNIVSSLQ
jgi:Flp pilus assembly pilin Flp